jgi:hypothetical protein
MPSPPFDGGCLCGSIRYRLADEGLTLYACHCSDCQRQTGSAFGLSMIAARSAFSVLRGEPQTYEVALPGERTWRGRLCARCGTRLWSEPTRFPEIVTLRPGGLDDTSWLRPVGHIWTRSAQPWVAIPAETLNYERQPDDYGPLIRAWRQRASP